MLVDFDVVTRLSPSARTIVTRLLDTDDVGRSLPSNRVSPSNCRLNLYSVAVDLAAKAVLRVLHGVGYIISRSTLLSGEVIPLLVERKYLQRIGNSSVD